MGRTRHWIVIHDNEHVFECRPRTQVPTAQYVQEGPNSMQLVGSSMPSSSSRYLLLGLLSSSLKYRPQQSSKWVDNAAFEFRPQQVRCHHHNQLNQAQMVPTVKDPQKQNYTLAGPSMLSRYLKIFQY